MDYNSAENRRNHCGGFWPHEILCQSSSDSITMQIDPNESTIRDIYQHMVNLITPRPIAWVTTVSESGITNLAPFSFFNGIGANPPALMFCPVNRRDGSFKHSLINAIATREFVVHVVSFDLAETMNKTSADYDAETSEIETLGLEIEDSIRVKPPRVKAAPAAFECTVDRIIHLNEGPAAANIVIGQVVMMHIRDDILGDDGFADPAKLDAVGRLGRSEYARTTDRFSLERAKVE